MSIALITALLYALNPSAILFSGSLMSEPIYLMLLVLWFYLEQKEVNGWAMGLLSVVLVLTRSVFMGMIPIWLYLNLRSGKRIVLFVLVFLTILIGNGIRMKMAYGHFILTTKQMGFGLFQGIELDGMDDDERGTIWLKKTGLNFDQDYLQLDRETFHEALRIMRQRPGDYAKMVVWKVFKFWRPIPRKYSGLVKLLCGLYYIPVLFLAFIGLYLAWGSVNVLVYWLFFYTTVLHAIHCETLRYRMPLEPFVCYFAAFTINVVWEVYYGSSAPLELPYGTSRRAEE